MSVSNQRQILLPWLLILFAGSGCAALIYEIVWLQLLQLVIGLTTVSLGMLLGMFMGGMCLGSLFLPRLISSQRHPLRVYALLEAAIGLIGIAVLFAIPYVGAIYTTHSAHGFAGMLLRAAVAAVYLLPPTLLMGATLPAIARWVKVTPQGIAWLGWFYGGNIVGAVFGCLLAGFYLLRVYDMATATYVAAAINGTVAAIALGLSAIEKRNCSSKAQETESDRFSLSNAAGSKTTGLHMRSSLAVHITIALSGLTALGAEVVWTRLISLLLGATVYTFSIILAVFLTGLGIGSSAGAFLARSVLRPRIALGSCQMLLGAAIAWTAAMISRSLPFWPVNPAISTSPWFTFQMDFVRCMWAIFPGTCLWGASFPLALASVAAQRKDSGRLVGGIYAANTLGAILGALGFSIL